MQWRGEFAFGEVWLAFRGASADNRFQGQSSTLSLTFSGVQRAATTR